MATEYTTSMLDFAAAIAYAEGFGASPGNKPTRANNPGDLVQAGKIRQFTHAAAGWAALFSQVARMFTGLSAIYNPSMTIAQVATKWTATEQEAWATNVTVYLNRLGYGVTTATMLAELAGRGGGDA